MRSNIRLPRYITAHNIDLFIWIKYRIRHLFRNSESISRDTMPEKIETSKYSILLWSMEEK